MFINFGYEYGMITTPYKKATETGFNRMHEVPLSQLLEYNALDALFCGKLFLKQKEVL